MDQAAFHEQIQALLAEKESLARQILDNIYAKRPALKQKYQKVTQQLITDILFHLEFLLEALRLNSIVLFDEYLKWCRTFYEQISIPAAEIVLTFDQINATLKQGKTAEFQAALDRYNARVTAIFESKYRAPHSFIRPNNPHRELAEHYFHTVLKGNRADASKLIFDALDAGTSVRDIYLEVFEPCQKEVGRQWQTGLLSVAQEHYFTAVTQLIISQLYPQIFSTTRIGKKMIAACAGGELHEIGIRMVADFFEMEGWDTLYIGANTPAAAIISTIKSEMPAVIALSTTLLPHIGMISDIISRIRSNREFDFTKIIVGGYPFNVDQDLWKRVHADGSAANAADAVQIAQKSFYYQENT
ncbi:MAG: cobalamin B12-binding domain-containing protein [Fidelibacterota bacterium]